MTKRRFIDLLRQFNQARRAHNASYAPQVNTLAKIRWETIEKMAVTESERVSLYDEASEAVQNEYGRFDSDFTLELDG